MRDYTRAKSFALSIIVNILLLLAVAVFIVPKIIQYQEEQLYVIDLESDWEPDNGGGHAGGGGGGRPNIAQAGGKNPAGVQAALAKAAEALAEELR